jgi:ubiquinone/menaquinone biosynthesis C-methylase UbiE
MTTKSSWTSRSSLGFYDLMGKKYDWFSIYEAQAKARAIELLHLEPGLKVLNIGMGTGKEHQEIQSAIHPNGTAIGLDLSFNMLKVAYQRTQAPVCQADAEQLPFPPAVFDRIFCAYVLDLLPVRDLGTIVQQFYERLLPGGRMVLLSLTAGVDRPSKVIVYLWKKVYSLSPTSFGGCQPIDLVKLVSGAGLPVSHREVIVQLGVPSQVLVSVRPG